MASHRIPFESWSTLERSRLMADNDRLRQQLRDRHRLADLAGSSGAIRRVRELIAQVAPSPHSVWLLGEPGVGKARAARAIHRDSTRAAGSFVVVNCASMPDVDVDAQLFGTDDDTTRVSAPMSGCLHRAAGGTLFFDEITNLGPRAQHRLALLARGRAWRGGDGSLRPAHARLIVATSRRPEESVAAGALHRDLWEHLGTLSILVPPLRERKSDLPLLTDLFVEEAAREQARGMSRVSGRAMDMLMSYDWPGNVRQLRRTIERAVAMTTGPVIHHHHLPVEIQEASGSPDVPMLGLSASLEAFERELLQDALRRARGVRSQAARLLMTSERVLGYRLRKHGIDARRFKTP